MNGDLNVWFSPLNLERPIIPYGRACMCVMYQWYYYRYNQDKMRTILATAVIACFFAVPTLSQFNFGCVTRLADLASCTTRLATATSNSTDFCNDCGNTLVSYYRDCTSGVGVDTVTAGDLWPKNLIMINCIYLHAGNHVTLLYIAGMKLKLGDSMHGS